MPGDSTPQVGAELTSRDPEPPEGSIVTCLGRQWQHDGDEYRPSCWSCDDYPNDPETWTKISGNYGPVTLVRWGDDPEQ
jgi:hypothetical protein